MGILEKILKQTKKTNKLLKEIRNMEPRILIPLVSETTPSVLEDGNTVLWVDAQENVTKDGSNLVSVWGDKSGNGNDLLQATGSQQPLWSADGILFDGVDDYLQTVDFTLEQPEFIYIVFKQVTWVLFDRIFDGNTYNVGGLVQQSSSSKLSINAPTTVNATTAPLDTFMIARVLFNGASSKLTINDETPAIDDAGANNLNGFLLAGRIDGKNSNIEVKEVIIRKVADSASDETAIYNYLADKYSI